jgi:hypothetical protein
VWACLPHTIVDLLALKHRAAAAINSLGQTGHGRTTVATNFEYFTYNAILGFSQHAPRS